jgi:hypothetical protein
MRNFLKMNFGPFQIVAASAAGAITEKQTARTAVRHTNVAAFMSSPDPSPCFSWGADYR